MLGENATFQIKMLEKQNKKKNMPLKKELSIDKMICFVLFPSPVPQTSTTVS